MSLVQVIIHIDSSITVTEIVISYSLSFTVMSYPNCQFSKSIYIEVSFGLWFQSPQCVSLVLGSVICCHCHSLRVNSMLSLS